MDIQSAQYSASHISGKNVSITLTFGDGSVVEVPISVANRHYAEILRQVAAGDLTIADAD
jgi:hypothetical protein